MNLYCVKCSMVTNNKSIEVKHEIGGEINFYSYCIDCGFQKIATINEKYLNDLLK